MQAPTFLQRFFEGAPAGIVGCLRCRGSRDYAGELRMAFQPIVDVERREVFAYEALVRGADGASAGQVLSSITPEQLYGFDQTCRVLAIDTAQRLGMQARLSINFLPNAVYEPATCIRLTLAAANKVGFPPERLIFEMTEAEQIRDPQHALSIVRDYQKRGFLTAIDDFGAGYSGLNLLADYQPQLVKLDMALVRDIERNRARQASVGGVLGTCTALGVQVIAEGVETRAEYEQLRRMGVSLFQGYLFARPAIEAIPDPDWSALG
ncbi:MAG: EAL domain-containing protein [Tepidimonas sp.]|uniref:EAL domain-containing protein n=1 Tax=Tepidimonas sp. TaxID=2002775 RepID=UPI00259F80C8|nr:EAL domain-containing protein [Tepidimonas sp.]MDM7456916.1 EAL domain-containing protein [Tepidimonas sp.]